MYTPGDRNNSYSFDDFVAARDGFDYYADDPFFQALIRHHTGDEAPELDQVLRQLSVRVSSRHRQLADEAGSLENRAKVTRITHHDAFNHRIDSIERCAATRQLEQDIFGLGLFDPTRNTAWGRFAKMFLLYQNGEFGVMCPIACTQGMIALMEKQQSDLNQPARALLQWVRDGVERDGARSYGRGAQYISEIQGGSDVAANMVEAEYDKTAQCWRLYGKKFFCSATQADVALVTAKPTGTESADRVAVFVVPSWLHKEKQGGDRNGYTIDRLKQKLGTAELPTAEITYNGAVAYPVGPLDQGLANIVAVTLTLSRLHCAFGMASALLRAAREAKWYAQFRSAFGQPVQQFPMVANQIDDLDNGARRSAAGVFKLYGEFMALGQHLPAGLRELQQIADLDERRRRFRLRELVLLQKVSVTHEAPQLIRLAMSVFGGHGIMEDFSALPRLLRDALIMELWEGPRNVLLTQIHRDLSRAKKWYPADAFARDLLDGVADAEPMAREFDRLMQHPSLFTSDAATKKICREWDLFSLELCRAYQNQALAEVGEVAAVPDFKEL